MFERPRAARLFPLVAAFALVWGAAVAHAQEDDDDDVIQVLETEEIVAPRVQEEVRSLLPAAELRVIDAWVPASTLTGDRLVRARATTIGEVLRYEPGVADTAFAPGASRPIIRGLAGDRVRILYEGLGTLDASNTSPDHAIAADPLTIRSAEVVRGPAALRFGGNAIGGAVNLIDGRIPSEPIPGGVRGLFDMRLGTADNERAGVFEVEARRGAMTYHAAGWFRRTDDMEIPGSAKSVALRAATPGDPGPYGTLPSSFVDSRGGTVGGSHATSRGFAGASITAIRHDYGVPNLEDEPVSIELESYRLDVRGGLRRPRNFIQRVDATFAYVDYEHTEFEGSEVGTVFQSKGIEGRLEASHGGRGRWEGTLGVEGSYVDLEAIGDEAFIPPSQTTRGSIYLIERWAVARGTSLTGGARAQFDHVDGPTTRRFTTFNASVGAVQQVGRNSAASANITYTERAPTSTELFADGGHVATQQYEIGDPNLDPERSVGLDVAFRHDSRRFSGEVTGFYSRYSDYIELIPNGVVIDMLPAYEFRAIDAYFYGAELRGAFHVVRRPGRTVSIEVLADWVQGRNRSQNSHLPRIPPFRFGISAVAQLGRWGGDLRLVRVTKQDKIAAFELPTDGYTMLDGGITYQIMRSRPKGPVLYLRALNLLDEEARVHSSFLKDLAPLRGRSFLFGLRKDL
ncbi:MAG: TonB-dependent receptor [Planctomycetota bacterium]|nr:TonB-dependent receptor [Planctomycetota bacterium]